MKQCIKYLMIILLVASLHSGVLEAASDLCARKVNYPEYAFRDQTSQESIIRHIYDHLLSLPVCIDYISTNHIPECKTITLPNSHIRFEPTNKGSIRTGYCTLTVVPHPLEYYIYGLRKIVV